MGLKILNKKLGRSSRNINYLGKDFIDFRENLITYAKTYFPTTYNDFNESSPGMMFIEMASYIGDVLAYYTDTTLKESFIQYATDEKNVFALANMLGYKPKTTSPAVTTLSVYQLCKADSNGEINEDYLVRIRAGLSVNGNTTTNNTSIFQVTDDIDFSDTTDREVSVYSINQITKKPDYFLIKKKVKAISAESKTKEIVVGNAEEFLEIKLDDTNVIGIENVTDSNGNIWYEVPYLAQEMVFIDYPNIAENDPDLSQFNSTVPYVLKLIKTSKRFVTRINEDFTISLHFGAGNSSYADELLIPNIKNVGLGLNNSINRLNESYDPTNFLKSQTYGQAPSNTTLTVKYLVGGGVGSNIAAGELTSINSIEFDETLIPTIQGFDQSVWSFVKQSVAVENEEPATGGKGVDSIDEIKQGTLAMFGSQNRVVTAKDYQIRSLSMPSKYGSVAKVYAVSDNTLNANSPEMILNSTDNLTQFTQLVKSIITSNSNVAALTTNDIRNLVKDFANSNAESAEKVNPFAINLFTLGYDANGNYISLNRAVKENLKTYLNEYRILTDGVNILDGFIINIGVEFEITVYKNYNFREVLLNCVDELKKYFSTENWQFNQPIYISDIELILATIDGVASVQKVEIVNKCGGDYSLNSYNIKTATKNKIIYPSLDPSIFEVKFPDKDIRGRVV
jgi:hypothetical protein